jgi:hypothetical protein
MGFLIPSLKAETIHKSFLLTNKTISEADLSGFIEMTRNTVLEIKRILGND